MKKRKFKFFKLSLVNLLLLLLAAFGAGYTTSYFIYQVQPHLQSPLQIYVQPNAKDILKEKVSAPPRLPVISHNNCLIKCPMGMPADNIFVDHGVIALSSNRKTKFADWVAYLVVSDYITGPARTRNWHKDPMIDAQYTFTPTDYTRMSLDPYLFDRGHQAPLAAFKNHPKWFALNYLSNITPQKKDLNRGAWKSLESAERKLVLKYQAAYVLTGPYYEENNVIQGPPIDRIKYVIPSGYWKIIATKSGDTIKTASFLFPQNTPPRDSHCKHLTSIPQVEKMTGLKFFDGKAPLEALSLNEDVGCGLKEELKVNGKSPKNSAKS